MSQTFNAAVSVVGIDIGKNSFHVVGHDERGAIVLRQKWSRGQVEARFANIPPAAFSWASCVRPPASDYGSINTPGFIMPFGSSSRLAPRSARANSSGRCLS
jgi:hypothetical protein